MAILVIVFASLFYGELALSTYGIVPPGVKMLPDAIIDISVVLYTLALLIGFYAFYSEQAPPSNLEVRDEQVSELETELDQLGGGK